MLDSLRRLPTDLDKFISVNALHERNETLFFRVVMDHPDEMMPLIYTPRSDSRASESRTSFSVRGEYGHRPPTHGDLDGQAIAPYAAMVGKGLPDADARNWNRTQ